LFRSERLALADALILAVDHRAFGWFADCDAAVVWRRWRPLDVKGVLDRAVRPEHVDPWPM
jgi:hypothetical protein